VYVVYVCARICCPFAVLSVQLIPEGQRRCRLAGRRTGGRGGVVKGAAGARWGAEVWLVAGGDEVNYRR
jgi:hypothetical protein